LEINKEQVMSKGIVYIGSNPAMPGIVKIGSTNNLEGRFDALYDTNVPFPFVCMYACEVDNYKEVEKAIHGICESSRVNKSREFFNIDPEKIMPVLKLLSTKDVTKAVEKQLTLDLKVEVKKIIEVSDKKKLPADYKTYQQLKEKLINKKGFVAGYFGIRVAAAHTRQKVPYYKYNNETYYRPDIFIRQAKSEGILKEQAAP
jgi:hypothetical protein